MATVLSYGGGRQTTAMCVLIARGVLPRPDRIVMADTGRERPSTWAYLAAHVQPMLSPLGLAVEIVSPANGEPCVHSNAGDLIIPAFTATSKFASFCSGTWKRDRVNSYLSGGGGGEKWIGFAVDEGRRIRKALGSDGRSGWKLRFPLAELCLTTADCLRLVVAHGLPEPAVSSCWMCPNQRNSEWRQIRVDAELWAKACEMDEQIRADDLASGGDGIWLHHSRVPLREADLDAPDGEAARQCGLGMCFV